MKRRKVLIMLTLSLRLFFFDSTFAQTAARIRNTDSLARKIIALINLKQNKEVYALAAPVFKNFKVEKQFSAWLCDTVFASVPMNPLKFIAVRGGLFTYRVGDLEMVLACDSSNHFTALGIHPYKKDQKTSVAKTDNQLLTHVDSTVHQRASVSIQRKLSVDISIAVFENGSKHFYNYGETARGNSELPTRHTLYETGSITKTFTSTLLALAVLQKRISLNASIADYLPDSVKSNKSLRAITLKQLANHTSGLPRLPENLSVTEIRSYQPYANYDKKKLYGFLKTVEVVLPGTQYAYSNLGAGLLGILLENIYSLPYQTLLNKYILQPGGLTETFMNLSTASRKLLAQGYNEEGEPVPPWQMNALKAAGGLKSTTNDLLTYGLLQTREIEDTLTNAVKLTHKLTYSEKKLAVGLGWHFKPENNQLIFHAGGTGGYSSEICINLKKQIIVVVLSNNYLSVEGMADGLTDDLSPKA